MQEKIGIVTFYDVDNQGAFLQAFALYTVIKNYHENVFFIPTERYVTNEHKVIPNNFEFEEYLPLREGKEWDLVVLGSDEIWNIRNAAMNYNKKYFGYRINAKRIISYAACCGNSRIRDYLRWSVGENCFELVDRISVRDDNTERLVKFLSAKRIERVLDPTFLIDWTKYLVIPEEGNYIVVYSYELEEWQKDVVSQYATENNYRIIDCLNSERKYTPFEWLGLMKNAEYIFSGTFHGTVFAMIFNVQFSVFGGYLGKVNSLLKEMELKERIIKNKKDVKRITKNIEWTGINEIISRKRNTSLNYLLEEI